MPLPRAYRKLVMRRSTMHSLIGRNGTMRIGIPREIKDGERRIALVPDAVRALTQAGHVVAVEAQAGAASGFADDEFRAAGAAIERSADAIWGCALIVRSSAADELAQLQRGSTILGFAQPDRTRVAARDVYRGRRIIAAGTVCDAHGALPLLAPMSRIADASRRSWARRRCARGGSGTITGVDDVEPARVVVGARYRRRSGADRRPPRVPRHRVLARPRQAAALVATRAARSRGRAGGTRRQRGRLDAEIATADLVIGAVLVPGTLSPKLISRAAVRAMRPARYSSMGIDQGGIAATSRMTTLSSPTYVDRVSSTTPFPTCRRSSRGRRRSRWQRRRCRMSSAGGHRHQPALDADRDSHMA